MSYYYKYNFISPEPTFAIIKEEFKTYFDTGAVDDLLFPTYVNKCLNKLGRSSYVIVPTVLYIEDFEARLPDNFYAVREAWLCTELPMSDIYSANALYTQATSTETIQIFPLTIGGKSCNNPTCNNSNCDGCMPEVIPAVYKTNYVQRGRTFKQTYLLKPGNISTKNNCHVGYSNTLEHYGQHNLYNTPNSSSYDSFDIRDNKFVTNFRSGVVHLLFYAEDYDDCGNQLIPDNYRIQEYIEAFIKYKILETLTNQVNDETFNQLQQKLVYYKQLSDEAYILAETEIKKQTYYQKQLSIRNTLNRFNMYKIPNVPYRKRY